MIKKILSILICMSITGSVFAASEETPENLMEFTPSGGGKFIYCNNPEEIRRNDLADDGENPSFIMNNENLTKDTYILYATHFNRVQKEVENTAYPGEDIWLDAVFTADKDTQITFYKTSFEIPENNTSYLNYETIKTEDTWSALYVCADLLGKPIHTLHTDKVFSPRTQTTHSITLKKGERMFLSSLIENYEAVPYPKHVMLASEFKITSGKCSVNVFAAKNRTDSDGTVAYPDVDFDSCGFGTYKRDGTYKGVADSLPETNAYLDYEIDDTVEDGAYLPVTVANQYYPKGTVLNSWTTNLNPQDDKYARHLVAESNIMPLYYKDPSKLTFYGEDAENKDDTWIFDTRHSNTTKFEGDAASGSTYSPNYELSAEKDNTGSVCSLGNYGITSRYNLCVTNNSEKDRYFEYSVTTAANVIVEVTDENGDDLQPVISKGQTNERTTETMASVLLPAGETVKFSIGMTLPVQNYGGQQQSFLISDKKTELDFKGNGQIKPSEIVQDLPDFSELYKNADEKTQKIFDGNSGYEIVKTDDGYAAYYKITEGNPYYYGYYWQITGKVFILDDSFNIKNELYLGSQPIEMSYAGGNLYVKTIASGSFVIKDGVAQPFGSYILPRESGSSIIYPKDNTLTLSRDGENYYKIAFQSFTPPFVLSDGNSFFYAYENKFGISSDGLCWDIKELSENIESALVRNGVIEAGGMQATVGTAPMVRINDEYLSFDAPPQIVNGRVMVPARFVLEKLGMKVLYSSEQKRILAIGTNGTLTFWLGKTEVLVNGEPAVLDAPADIYDSRLLIPLRFISEKMGAEVTWSDNTAVITGTFIPFEKEIDTEGDVIVALSDRNSSAGDADSPETDAPSDDGELPDNDKRTEAAK